MKLLCITDVNSHPPFDTTVELYRKISEDSRFLLCHTTPAKVMKADADRLEFESVETCRDFREFLSLTGNGEIDSWSNFDLVFCRTDKPFLDGYHTHLGKFETQVPFVNSPSGCVVTSRKQYLERFFHLMAPSISTSKLSEALVFAEGQGAIVVKLDYSYGGKGIVRMVSGPRGIVCSSLEREEVYQDWRSALAPFLPSQLPVQLVRYLKKAPDYGDKRVLVVDGEIYGGYVRKGKAGNWIHNITAGGSAHRANVTLSEVRAIEATWQSYAVHGMRTLGYDFLMNDDDNWILSEVNAGNIGGYGRLEELSGAAVYSRLLNSLYHSPRRMAA